MLWDHPVCDISLLCFSSGSTDRFQSHRGARLPRSWDGSLSSGGHDRGDAYRVAGYFRDAGNDLQAALAKAEQGNDHSLIAASSGALGNLAFMSRRAAVAEPLLKRSHDLASRLPDPAILAASNNDLGNLYASTGRLAEADKAYAEAIASADAAHDDTLAATAETNAARLALRRKDTKSATALLKQAVETLERSPASYSRGTALVSAGSAAIEGEGPITSDARTVASHAFRTAIETAEVLHNPTLSSLAQGGLGHLYERDNQLDEASRLSTGQHLPLSRHRHPNSRSPGIGSARGLRSRAAGQTLRLPATAGRSPSCSRSARISRSNTVMASRRIAPPSVQFISNSVTCCCAALPLILPARHRCSGKRGMRSSS